MDSDGDTVLDCNDKCPEDPDKLEGGVCGCGKSDKDSDGDKVPDCNDKCPQNDKRSKGSCDCAYDVDEPGICGGCDAPDEDGDTVLDCEDKCPRDAKKNEPGACGCGNVDDDFDLDTVQFTDDDKNRAFLTAPLFTDLKNNYISNLLIDVDFYNNKTAVKQNTLHASLANKMVASTLENVGFSGELKTVLSTDDVKYAYGCLVGIVDKDSSLKDVYATNAKISTNGKFTGGLVGSLESNLDVSVKKSSINLVYTDNDKRGIIGGLFGSVSGNGNITITDVTVDKVSGTNYIGGLIGNSKGGGVLSFSNVTVGSVSGGDAVGGLIGHFQGKQHILANQIAVGSVSAKSFVGGVVGHAESGFIYIDQASVENALIQCKDNYGGIIGYLHDHEFSLTNIDVHTKEIKGTQNVGGVAGYVNFSISDKTEEFKNIKNSVDNIIFDSEKKSEKFYAGGMIGYLLLTGSNESKRVIFDRIISRVNNLDVKSVAAGLIGYINRGENENKRRIRMIDVLSILDHINSFGDLKNCGGFLGALSEYVYIEAERVVSVAVLPEERAANALFGSYKGEGRFTPHNVFWYQFGGYTNSTTSAKGTEDQVQELTSDTASDVVDTMNADSVTKWKLESAVNIGGLQYDIPRPEWQ